MKYVYTSEMCGNCIKLKKEYDEKGVKYIERDAKRLKQIPDDYDKIDEEAFALLCGNNMELPVVVEDGVVL